MKQMKIDDNSFSEATTTANDTSAKTATDTSANSNSNTNETLEQLNKINNTLLLIVDKISAIETEIKMLKEVKQQRCNDDDNEEHIKLQIEEKDIISEVEILANVKEVEDEEEEDSDDEEVDKVLEKVISKAIIKAEESESDESELEEEEEEEEISEAVNKAEESSVVNLEEEETDESEVEIEDEVAEVSKAAEVTNLEEDEEEVFEIEIDDVTYFATHEENGILYEVDKDGDVGKKVGIIKDGEPIFL